MTPRRAARWTPALGAGMHALLHRRARLLSDAGWWASRTAHIQRTTLHRLLSRARSTRVGREFAFESLLDVPPGCLADEYRRRVPLRDYEGWRDDFAIMREQAAPDIAWPGVVADWAQTSGTTGGEKFIPVTTDMMRSNRKAALDIFAHAMRFGVRLPDLFAGRLLFLGGSTDVATSELGIRTGDLSGLAARTIRWPLSSVYSPGLDIALMSDWPAKIEAMAARCVREDVRMVSGMASWALVVFARVLELAREQGRDARTLRDVWPNLRLFVHGGVKYPPFDPRVRTIWSGSDDVTDPRADIPARLEVYPASEGFFAMQDTPGDPSLRLCVDTGIVYEFVPLDEIDSEEPTCLLCHEVRPGQRYVLVVTTCSGLWRYVVGDVVEFDTVPPDGPARLRIVGRHRHFINAFGENLIVEQIESAVARAQQTTGAPIGEFTAAPVYPAPGRRAGLELAIEWLGDDRSRLDAFRDAFDAALKEQNVDYTTKRTEDLGMDVPVLTPLPAGAFHRWMEARGKLGGQHKTPRCANGREIIDDVVRVNA